MEKSTKKDMKGKIKSLYASVSSWSNIWFVKLFTYFKSYLSFVTVNLEPHHVKPENPWDLACSKRSVSSKQRNATLDC